MHNSSTQYISTWLSKFDISLSHSFARKVRNLINDSRQIEPGDIFCAVIGTLQDGTKYIDAALKAGSDLILKETKIEAEHGNISYKDINASVPVVSFYQLNKKLFELAESFYQSPQSQCRMIGVTGTNGKTTTSQLIAQLSEKAGITSAVIGTNGAGKLAALKPIANTTPGATELHQLLNEFVEQGVKHVAMEVSSHALAQGRVKPEMFNVAVFTNLSRDHLDYHGTMQAYGDAKQELFTQSNSQWAILNGNDQTAQQWLADWPCAYKASSKVWLYGKNLNTTELTCYLSAENVRFSKAGIEFTVKSHLGSADIQSPLLGSFNIDNLLAAMSVLLTSGIELNQLSQLIPQIIAIDGRMESFSDADMPLAVVDYAHTPDALENALNASRLHCEGELWVVFGCGGNRDKGKRPQMGAIAEKLADKLIVTNDNPRNEAPEAIAEDILKGCQQPEKVTVMLARQQAVITALTQAKKDDVVVLAGKGHEDYIEIADQKINYNEREVVASHYNKGTGQ